MCLHVCKVPGFCSINELKKVLEVLWSTDNDRLRGGDGSSRVAFRLHHGFYETDPVKLQSKCTLLSNPLKLKHLQATVSDSLAITKKTSGNSRGSWDSVYLLYMFSLVRLSCEIRICRHKRKRYDMTDHTFMYTFISSTLSEQSLIVTWITGSNEPRSHQGLASHFHTLTGDHTYMTRHLYMSKFGLEGKSVFHLGQRCFLCSAQHDGGVHHQTQQGRTRLERKQRDKCHLLSNCSTNSPNASLNIRFGEYCTEFDKNKQEPSLWNP